MGDVKEKNWKTRIADDIQNAREAKRERSIKKEEGRQTRKNAKYETSQKAKLQRQEANLALRNKAFDYMMEDSDTRRFMIETAKDTYTSAKKVLKVAGISLLVGAGVFFTYKIVTKFIDSSAANSRINQYTENMDKKNLSYKEQDYSTWADKLYRTGFDQNATFWVNYNESVIKEILKKLKTLDDWKYLVKVFGARPVKVGDGKGETHELTWFLSQDDDAQDYQDIINKLGANIQL